MADPQAGAQSQAHSEDPRFDARCQLCSRVAGQLVNGVFVHHPDCARKLVLEGGVPRCCDCGGRLYFEEATTPLSSAADREAARRFRPSYR